MLLCFPEVWRPSSCSLTLCPRQLPCNVCHTYRVTATSLQPVIAATAISLHCLLPDCVLVHLYDGAVAANYWDIPTQLQPVLAAWVDKQISGFGVWVDRQLQQETWEPLGEHQVVQVDPKTVCLLQRQWGWW